MGSAFAALLLPAAPSSSFPDPAAFADVYGWVYRTGRDVEANTPAAACLGLNTPARLYERTWLAPDGRAHAIEVSEDRNHAFLVMSVQYGLHETWSGTFWLASSDGRLLVVCNVPFVNASFVAVKDGSRDAAFQAEKTYFLEKFAQRARWDRYRAAKRDYP